MSQNDHSHAAEISYQKALKGEHPDIKSYGKWKMHPNEAANRAVSFYLRDIFTPITKQFHDKIMAIGDEKFREIAMSTKFCRSIYSDGIFADFFAKEAETGEFSQDIERIAPQGLDREEFCRLYHELPPAGQRYYWNMLGHSNSVASLGRYRLSDLVQGKYREYYWCPTDEFIETLSHAVDTTVVPVGGYGVNCALHMLLVTNILVNLAGPLMTEIAKEVECSHQEIIYHETARGQVKKQAIEDLEQNKWKDNVYRLNDAKRETIRISALDSLKEVLHSIQAAISSFMAEKIGLYADYRECLQAIAKSNLPSRFARIVPFGYTLPVIRRGRYFPKMVIPSGQNLDFSDTFRQCSRFFKEDYLKTRVYIEEERNPGMLGFGCPASIKSKNHDKNGVEFLMDTYLHVFTRCSDMVPLMKRQNDL